MTRINCVPVEELSDKHLVAEYRELPRVINLARLSFERQPFIYEGANDKWCPLVYCLGPGHVRFFYNKMKWLRIRYEDLVHEMVRRGFKPSPALYEKVLDSFRAMPAALQGDWVPNATALNLNRLRIQERLNG